MNDHLGNTRITYIPKVVDNYAPITYSYLGQKAINRIVNVVDYFPYGKVLREYTDGNGEDRYLTTHHERDKETGYDNRGAEDVSLCMNFVRECLILELILNKLN